MGIFNKTVVTALQSEYKPLFDAFEQTERFKQKGYDSKFSLRKNQMYTILTKEDLNAIKEVTIHMNNDAKKLISKIYELCPNLEVLNVYTLSDVFLTEKNKNIFNAKVYQINSEEKKQDFINKMYDWNKLTNEDMQHIYNLKNLQELRIPSQNKITELDLSKLPNLKILLAKDCINLKEIVGLNDNLFYNNYATFDFTGCERLSDKTIDQIATKFDPKRFENQIVTPGHLFLPLNVMLRKTLNNSQNFVEFGKNYQRDAILFSQSSNGVLLNHFASDVQKFCKGLDDIIENVCDFQKNELKNVLELYQWVTNNIVYDFATTELEKQNFEEINQNEDAARDASKNRSEKTRSAIYTLKRKYGVCVGISELFASLITRAGLAKEVRQVACSNQKVNRYMQASSNHQITSIKFDGVGEYYFDPTNDLGRIVPRYFARNKQEISQKYTLSYRENFVINAPSLYKKNAIDVSEPNV